MLIQTRTRRLDLPLPTIDELKRRIGRHRNLWQRSLPTYQAIYAAGARDAVEAMENARGARREAELIEVLEREQSDG